MKILVLGAGAIGTCAAYFLAARGADVTVIERHAVAGAASGKLGGFLARDWCDGSALESLGRRSFALHASLAETLEANWFYRPVTTFGGALGTVRRHRPRHPGPSWLQPDVRLSGQLGSTRTTAQVQPAAFTRGMMRVAERHGASLRIGEVTGLRRRRDTVVGVEVGGETLDADAVVIALGPWSIRATQWLPLPPVFGLKGHSIVFDVKEPVPAEALFLEVDDGGETLSPEVFPRADGTVYVCAISTDTPLPADPAAVEPDPGALDRLHALCRRIAPVLAAAPVVANGACYRPVTRDGLPLIGAVPSLAGAYVATGHGVWGILNAPATGEALAALILGDAPPPVDLTPFDPGRLPVARRG